MKVIYTTHQFLPDYSTGTEILAYNTAKEFAKRGNEVSVFTALPLNRTVKGSGSFDCYEYDGILVDRYYHPSRFSLQPKNAMEAEYNNLFFADHFRERLSQIKPDIVHFYHLQRLSLSAIDVCVELKIPTIYTATDFWLMCPATQLLLPDHSLCLGPNASPANCLRHMVFITQGKRMKWIVDRLPEWFLNLFIRLARYSFWPEQRYLDYVRALATRPSHVKNRINQLDLVLVTTKFMVEMLRRYGLEGGRIRHLSFGVDNTHVVDVSKRGMEKELRLGFIGTLSYHKGAHVLIEAVRKLSADKRFKVKIYGSLEQVPEYAEILIKIAGDDERIEFCGTFPHDKIGGVLNGIDVLIVSSLWYENTPLVILSAQAARVPVVATNLGGMNEVVINGENGFLFEKGDAAGLAEIISTLCNNSSLVERLSNRARKPKSIPTYADELEELYSEVMDSKS